MVFMRLLPISLFQAEHVSLHHRITTSFVCSDPSEDEELKTHSLLQKYLCCKINKISPEGNSLAFRFATT
jgi:hypothetical protein